MNQSNTELEALKRIVIETERFRANLDNLRQGAYGPHLNEYLKQHLSFDDWQLWQRLQIDWEQSR